MHLTSHIEGSTNDEVQGMADFMLEEFRRYIVNNRCSMPSMLLKRLSTIHVYHWTIGSYAQNTVNETMRPLCFSDDFYRHPLSDEVDRWREYIQMINTTGRSHYLLLEFVKDDSPEQVVTDAEILKEIVK